MIPSPMWVFAYGSLMWNPGFPVAERRVADLTGYHRSFCMWSIHHRGTEENPGLVLALDATPQASCRGLALRVEPGAEEVTLAELRDRELVSSAYLERVHDIRLDTGADVSAVTYVVDPDHVQYTGQLALEVQAHVIARAIGGRGPNTDYLYNTANQLSDIGIEDADLAWLVQRVRQITTS